MRIAYIVTDLGRGGTQGWVEYSALELVKLGHKVTVIAETTPHDRKSKLEEHGVIVHAFEAPAGLPEYCRIIKNADTEVIHLNIWERYAELIQLRVMCNVPVAISYHSVPKISWKLWVVRIIKPSIRHWAMYEWFSLKDAQRCIDAHIGCCEASTRGIRSKMWPFLQRRIFSLPNAVPLPESNTDLVSSGPPRFLQVGALNERKNPFLTLVAFEKIQYSIPDSTLTFVGSGTLYNDLVAYVRERSLKNVFLVGEVQDPASFYSENNILILPSKAEGLPYTLIEGAGHGMALIVSNVDGNPEICINGYNGILLSDISVTALQEAMISLATNQRLRSSMGNKGRTLVKEKFDMKPFVDKLLNVYGVDDRAICMKSQINPSEFPKISIVTPSYNQVDFIDATLKSVLDQGYPNLEYIVMDGGSTDGSVEIIKKYADRLVHWESAPDKGQADAIFRGFERATGEILGWVNSDDLLLPGCLERVGNWFRKHPEEEWVVGGSVIIDHDGKPVIRSRRGLPEGDLGVKVTFKRLLLHNCGGFHQPASFWKRDVFFANGGFDRSLRFCFDYDMYFRLAKRKSSGHMRSFLAAFRYHPVSKTSTLDEVFHAENEILWRKYGRYVYSEDQIKRYAKNQTNLDGWRNRIIKLGIYLKVLKPLNWLAQ